MKKALVLGCGGFIAHHLVNRLKDEGFWVKGADLKYPRFSKTACDEFLQGDLRDQVFVNNLVDQKFDEIYQLAADMGGAGYIFTGENDADVMTNSALINLNILDAAHKSGSKRIFYSSSACIYPEYNQLDPDNPKCSEDSAYPAAPDSEYGWEKLFSERMYASYARNKGMEVRIARYHNIYGPEGSWNDGKEKAPAALCRKVAMANNEGEIEVWGDGIQTRSFLYIDDCIDATIALTRSEFEGPVNIGSEEMISINNLALLIADVSEKKITINNIPGPEGVRGRNSDNKLIGEKIGWQPKYTLRDGIEKTYPWIDQQVKNNK
ncbi:MAG: NAD-dependent epimerase/dehydratase family protein [SAR86 cluster bacterium]|nr:NAD-dependent epimerase/dehydratase family protein [SAR86 cluster bacterium]